MRYAARSGCGVCSGCFMEGLHAASYNWPVATVQKFTDLIREDIIWCELCRLNLLHSFK
jgi:hypothetical protein